MRRRTLLGAAIATVGMIALPAHAGLATTLEAQFRDPPSSARPRVWWHWMNGNITKDGIAKDLAWMKRVGIGGLQNFDINLDTPIIVAHRLAYMSPAWQDAFRFAAREADRLGLELAIASSPGWSESGGPWVTPADGLKKLVWSQMELSGERRFAGRLPMPPGISGQYQGLPNLPDLSDLLAGRGASQGPAFFRDVAVLAVPLPPVLALPAPTVTDARGAPVAAEALVDDDLLSGVSLPAVTSGEHAQLVYTYKQPVTVRSATMFLPGAAIPLVGAFVRAELQASPDGTSWQDVVELHFGEVPATVSFRPVTALAFRLSLIPLPPSPAGSGTPDLGVAAKNPFADMISAKLAQPLVVGAFTLSGEPRIDGAEEKAGFALVPDYYALPEVGDGAAGPSPARTIDLTSRLRPDGSLDWTPPAGRWRVLRIGYSLLGTTNHPAPKEATGLEVDKYDGPAVRRYAEHYLATYRAAAGPDLIGQRGVRALLTDSIEVGAANWTPRLIEQFKRLRGYDPTPWLPTLTGMLVGSRQDADRFLYDFRRTLADLIASEHYGTIAAVAHEHGLKVYGEALESNRPTLGDDMAMRRHTDVPMGAMWAFDRATGPAPNFLADLKGASSVAHIYGQNLVAAESMTAGGPPWGFAPADLKHVVDLEFLLGVNRPVVHTSVHAPVDDRLPGLTLGGIGQYFNRQESWAELAAPWVDYIARNAFLLQQGRNVADVAYFYGEEAPLTGLYGRAPVADAPRDNAFDFVNADALLHALRNDGGDLVTAGGARYRLLYLGGSSRRMTLPVLRRIAELVEGGATILGPRPDGDPSLGDDAADYAALVARLWPGGAVATIGRGRVIAGTDVQAALRLAGVPADVRVIGAGEGALPFVHRQLEDGDSYFLVNRLLREMRVDARFRVAGKAPELWDAETGSVRPVTYRIENGETIVPLTLAGEQSIHVVFRKPAVGPSVTVPDRPVRLAGELAGPWSVTFQPGRGAPASATFAPLAPLDRNGDPGIRYFSGVATYAHAFATPPGWRAGEPLLLDLGEAREVAEVRVNGALAGYVWHPPYRLDVGAVARRGANRVEIRVANLWVNRLIGDAQPGASKITWTAGPTYRADAPLRRSGLIGPVRLLTTTAGDQPPAVGAATTRWSIAPNGSPPARIVTRSPKRR